MAVENRLYTVEEFEQFIAQAENEDRLFELIDGELVEKMPTREHGIIAADFATDINIYLRQNPIGRVAVEARHRPIGDEHNDRLPDVSVVLDINKPVEREGAALYMPDLAVEIKSPNDSLKKMRAKTRYYLANGTRIVWLALPDQRVIEVYTLDDEYVVGEGEFLNGGDVLPNFTLAVSSVFRV
ncbi:MAG: Uma2 family endonuclease [Burkholderiales bacterium]|nr:Uma2 family endonuclease [Anaerolineae bacterium]